jgi:hypothetical protein
MKDALATLGATIRGRFLPILGISLNVITAKPFHADSHKESVKMKDYHKLPIGFSPEFATAFATNIVDLQMPALPQHSAEVVNQQEFSTSSPVLPTVEATPRQEAASYWASLPTWNTATGRLAPRFLNGWLALLLAWVAAWGVMQPQGPVAFTEPRATITIFSHDGIIETIHATVGENAMKLLSVGTAVQARVTEMGSSVMDGAHGSVAAKFAMEDGLKGGSYHSAIVFHTLPNASPLTLTGMVA